MLNIKNNKYKIRDKKYYLLKHPPNNYFYKEFKYGGQFVSNPLKKYYKKLSSSKRRRIIRDWIEHNDWDKRIETFRFDKSYTYDVM